MPPSPDLSLIKIKSKISYHEDNKKDFSLFLPNNKEAKGSLTPKKKDNKEDEEDLQFEFINKK